jgi:DNA mismatch endonuclease, patch repair protein
MQRQRQRDTMPELALRSVLHRDGLRYRVHYPLLGVRRRADIAFPRLRVAVFCDGCFWHGCPEHGTWPKQNAAWWRQKIEANKARDEDTNARLKDAGWRVVRIWAHEDPVEAANRVAAEVSRRRA